MKFFSLNRHEVQNLTGHSSPTDSCKDKFFSIIWTHFGETKKLHFKNDGTDLICTTHDPNTSKALFNVSDSFQEGRNINNRRKWQAPPRVVEAEVQENCYFGNRSDSEDSYAEISDEHLVLHREIGKSQKASDIITPFIFVVHEIKKTLRLTTDTLDCDNISRNREKDCFEYCPILARKGPTT